LGKVKSLIKRYKKELHDIGSNFTINNELLSHVKSEIEFDDQTFDAHIFLNEKAELDQRQLLIKELIHIEENTIKNKKFESLKYAMSFKEENIAKRYWELFKWNKFTSQLERNNREVKNNLSKFGYFILSTNRRELDKSTILENYRNKDQVEKVFDSLKNRVDGNRLRVHSQYNAEAVLFLKFIALIIQSEIIKTMRSKKLFVKYSVKEILAELKKIKLTCLKDEEIISEISKKQRLIFEAFEIDVEDIHSY
jgi:transposase